MDENVSIYILKRQINNFLGVNLYIYGMLKKKNLLHQRR